MIECPDDNMLLALALDGKADYIVSGDKDLLDLKKVANLRVVSARYLLGEILDREPKNA